MILTLIEFAVAGAGIFGLIFKVYWLLYAAAALCIEEIAMSFFGVAMMVLGLFVR